MADDRQLYVRYVAAFWALEFAFLAGLVVIGAVTKPRRSSDAGDEAGPRNASSAPPPAGASEGLSVPELRRLVVALLVLIILPIFSLGIYNDLAMRASIPALFILWISAARIIGGSSLRGAGAPRIIRVLVLASLVVGAYPAAVNVRDSLTAYHFGPPDLSSVPTTTTANRPEIVAQRFGDSNSIFYQFLGR